MNFVTGLIELATFHTGGMHSTVSDTTYSVCVQSNADGSSEGMWLLKLFIHGSVPEEKCTIPKYYIIQTHTCNKMKLSVPH